MNIDFIADFRDIILAMQLTYNHILAYNDKPIQIGRFKDRKFLKLDDQVIEFESLQVVMCTLIIKIKNDDYLLVRTNSEARTSPTEQDTDVWGMPAIRRYDYDTKVIKCSSLYDIACVLEAVLSDGERGTILLRDNYSDKTCPRALTVNTKHWLVYGVEYNNEKYDICVDNKLLILSTQTFYNNKTDSGIARSYTIVKDLKDNKYKLIYYTDINGYNVIYETINEIKLKNYASLLEIVDENTKVWYTLHINYADEAYLVKDED